MEGADPRLLDPMTMMQFPAVTFDGNADARSPLLFPPASVAEFGVFCTTEIAIRYSPITST